nr:hypothetical protein [Actinomycetota bacterium]
MKSANDLLDVIVSELPEVTPGVQALAFEDGEDEGTIQVATGLLRQAIGTTQPIRHARPSQGSRLQPIHVEALVALDDHPALRRLRDEHFDEYWKQETHNDRHAQVRAAWYVEQLRATREEWDRRRTDDYLDQFLPADPKDRYGGLGTASCPVCEQDALVVTRFDDFGAGVGAGTCCVCGYTRTEFMANDEAETRRMIGY